MAEFINTIDLLGDEVVIDSIIDRTVTEFKDDNITSVGRYAFHGCTALKTVELPNVTYLDQYAFQSCSALSSISFPALKSLGQWAFAACTALDEVCFPEVITPGIYMFRGAGVTKVKLPAATSLPYDCLRDAISLHFVDLAVCTAIAARAFYNSGNVTTLILRSDTICTVDANSLAGTYTGGIPAIARGTGYIYVPRALVDSYKAATNWSTYADQFRALEDYTVDGTTTGELDETKI